MTPPEIQARIDALTRDIYSGYEDLLSVGKVGGPPPAELQRCWGVSVWLARSLVRAGWAARNEPVPECPNGNLLCFDPGPHPECRLW